MTALHYKEMALKEEAVLVSESVDNHNLEDSYIESLHKLYHNSNHHIEDLMLVLHLLHSKRK
jgi:hypothetical protein